MVIQKESLSDFKEQYEKAIKLFEEDSKHDPIANPFKSAYEARKILTEISLNLKNVFITLEDSDSAGKEVLDDVITYKCILGFVYKDLGRNFVGTEEYSEGEKFFKLGVEILQEFRLNQEAVIPYVECLNELGLWGIRNDAKNSIAFLDEAEEVYESFIVLHVAPFTISDLFGSKDEVEVGKGLLALEKDHTLTYYYKAQALTQMEDLHSSAWYCHKTLKRQLEFKDFEPIDWALNAAVLSQYFFSNYTLVEARQHLSAANVILDNYEQEMITDDMSEDKKGAVREQFEHRHADLMRCWAKYGIFLLQASKERLMTDDDEKKQLPDISNLKIYSENLQFDTLDLSKYENSVANTYCLTFDEAKPIFLKVLEWLNKAMEYYNADSEATEHAQIVQDLSSAYNQLAFFEEDGSNQCKLHKRRADLLEGITKNYNSTYYLKVCREAWYELGLIYSNMLDIKLDIINELSINDRPSAHVINKINLLCDKSIQNFSEFVASYPSIDTLPVDEQQAICICFFHIGRLHYKKISSDKIVQSKNVSNSLKNYNTFVEKVSANENLTKMFKAELAVCREMISLLPRKLQMLLEEIK